MAGYVSASAIQGGGTNTGSTWNHATGTETNSCLIIAIFFGDSAGTVSNVTVGGNNATFLGRQPSPIDVYGVEVWTYPGVTGTVSVVTSYASAEGWSVSVLANDVDQTTPVRDTSVLNKLLSGADSSAVAVDSAVGDLILSFIAADSATTISTANTLITDDAVSDYKGVARSAGSATSTTMTWNQASGVSDSNHFALSLKSPAGGGGSSTQAENLTSQTFQSMSRGFR